MSSTLICNCAVTASSSTVTITDNNTTYIYKSNTDTYNNTYDAATCNGTISLIVSMPNSTSNTYTSYTLVTSDNVYSNVVSNTISCSNSKGNTDMQVAQYTPLNEVATTTTSGTTTDASNNSTDLSQYTFNSYYSENCSVTSFYDASNSPLGTITYTQGNTSFTLTAVSTSATYNYQNMCLMMNLAISSTEEDLIFQPPGVIFADNIPNYFSACMTVNAYPFNMLTTGSP